MGNNIKFICADCKKSNDKLNHFSSIELKIWIPKYDEQTELTITPRKFFCFDTPGLCKECMEKITGDKKEKLNFKGTEREYLLKIIERLFNNPNTKEKKE